MSGGAGGWGVPGIGAERAVSELREIYWGGSAAQIAILWQSAVISSTARDAGNSPTTILRPGLLLGRITASGEYAEWNHDATDGTQFIAGVLDTEMKITDYDATAQDRVYRVCVARAPLKSRKLLIEGVAFIAHANEYLARQQLAKGYFVLDDDPCGLYSGAGGGTGQTIAKAADYTVVASDTGKTFTNQGASAAITFTLPAIKAGLVFDFYSEDNDGVIVTAATADTMVGHNDAAFDSVALTTTGRNIGGRLRVQANADATKWLVTMFPWNIADDGSTITKAAITT
jgi:hypothetical protein